MVIFDELNFVLLLCAAVGCGLVAGVFFAFSTFVMKALARLPTAAGITAMQTINVTVLGPWFMSVFFGSGVLCPITLITSLKHWEQRGMPVLCVGSTLYLVGSILVTVVFNVPKNQRLAVLSATAPDVENQWLHYVSTWTAWNHVRTVASLVASAAFSCALGVGAWPS